MDGVPLISGEVFPVEWEMQKVPCFPTGADLGKRGKLYVSWAHVGAAFWSRIPPSTLGEGYRHCWLLIV